MGSILQGTGSSGQLRTLNAYLILLYLSFFFYRTFVFVFMTEDLATHLLYFTLFIRLVFNRR